MRCRRWSRRPGLFYVLQIFLWTASFRVNTEIVAWSTVRRILWRFLTCVRHAFSFSMWRSYPGYVLKVYYWWRTCLWLAFRKQFSGTAYLKINLLVKTPLHRRSMEVRRSGLWAPENTWVIFATACNPCWIYSYYICHFFYTCLTAVSFKSFFFWPKLRKQFASKFLRLRSILDISGDR